MRCLWTLPALLLLACSSLLADEILLRNGDRISGEVVRLEDGSLLVRTQAMGDVRVKWDAVTRVAFVQPMEILADAARVRADLIERGEQTDIVTAARTQFSVAPGRIQVMPSSEPSEAQPAPWSGTADLGLAASRGNSDSTNFNMGLKGARTTDATRLSLSFSSLQARDRGTSGDTITSANVVRSGARYEVNVSDHVFVFGFGNLESNRVQNLVMRDVFGGGAGIRAAQTRQGSFDLFTGASMNHEAFSAASATPNRVAAEMLVGGQSSYSLSNRTSLAGRFSMYPNLTQRGEYRTVLDTSASTKLNSWLGWQVTLSQVYVSNPAQGARPSDMILSTGLRFSVGQERPFKSRTGDVKLQ
jgi:putative salt-induced outer membrane protein YdiY